MVVLIWYYRNVQCSQIVLKIILLIFDILCSIEMFMKLPAIPSLHISCYRNIRHSNQTFTNSTNQVFMLRRNRNKLGRTQVHVYSTLFKHILLYLQRPYWVPCVFFLGKVQFRSIHIEKVLKRSYIVERCFFPKLFVYQMK